MTFLTDTFVGRGSRVQIGAVQVDASVSETHGLDGTVTEHPVEDGSPVTDHFRMAPRSIQIDAVVTGTPIEAGFPGATVISSISSLVKGDDPVLLAWEEIKRYFEQKVRIDIATSLETYKNMMLVSFAATRNAQTGQTLTFSCSAREMRVVQTATVAAIQIPETRTTTVQIVENKGKKATGKANKARGKTGENVLGKLGM